MAGKPITTHAGEVEEPEEKPHKEEKPKKSGGSEAKAKLDMIMGK